MVMNSAIEDAHIAQETVQTPTMTVLNDNSRRPVGFCALREKKKISRRRRLELKPLAQTQTR